MRDKFKSPDIKDPRITYRGEVSTRMEFLTDAVFGIAITLLIFNVSNADSFQGLLEFTKTLPAFMVSILFLFLIWKEHVQFAEVYRLEDRWLTTMNTLFIAIIIFYVYPLRFLTLFLTALFFNLDLNLSISYSEVPYLMYYYGLAVFLLYFFLFLFYRRALAIRDTLGLSDFELFYTKEQSKRMAILFIVPLISVVVTFVLTQLSVTLAPMYGGITYWLLFPGMMIWQKKFTKNAKGFDEVQS